VDYFKDQTLQDICATSADMQSNGFAAMLYENLKRTYDIPDEK
jgi:flagellar protein FlgJ